VELRVTSAARAAARSEGRHLLHKQSGATPVGSSSDKYSSRNGISTHPSRLYIYNHGSYDEDAGNTGPLVARTDGCIVGDHFGHNGVAQNDSQGMSGLLALLAHFTHRWLRCK